MLKWMRSLPVVTGDPLQGAAVPVLLLLNLAFNVIANASFKLSALGGSWQSFLGWQVAGNLAGFITVITLTWLLRYHPLHLVFPVTTGLAVVGVQVLAAARLFHEPIGPRQWLGTLLIVLGIFFIGGRG
jgi:multidrug transporter EmrE-like cation transporter